MVLVGLVVLLILVPSLVVLEGYKGVTLQARRETHGIKGACASRVSNLQAGLKIAICMASYRLGLYYHPVSILLISMSFCKTVKLCSS